jgi:hypothetical protein
MSLNVIEVATVPLVPVSDTVLSLLWLVGAYVRSASVALRRGVGGPVRITGPDRHLRHTLK